MNEIKYKLVAVEWVDSYGCGAEWEEMPVRAPSAHHCYSVGWMTAKTKDVVVIVPHISPENAEIGGNEQGCGDMTIPRCAVRKIVNLEPKA